MADTKLPKGVNSSMLASMDHASSHSGSSLPGGYEGVKLPIEGSNIDAAIGGGNMDSLFQVADATDLSGAFDGLSERIGVKINAFQGLQIANLSGGNLSLSSFAQGTNLHLQTVHSINSAKEH
jgi:hypothetical protein